MYWADNVLETSTTVGTISFVLSGAGRTYAAWEPELGNNRLTAYMIRHRTTSEWERGLGYITGGTTLVRSKVIDGSNGASAVVFTVGQKLVYISVSAEFIDGATHLKTPCVVAATANVVIASGLNAGDILNGMTLQANQRVLLPFQTDESQNGIWITGPTPARALDLWTGAQAAGTLVPVQSGTLYPGTLWQCTSAVGSDIVGTNNLTWKRSGTGNVSGPNPSTLNSVPRWNSTDGTELEDSEIIIHPSANDKLETNATFMAWTLTADGSTVTFDLDATDKHYVTKAGDRLLAVSNASQGQRISLLRYQDGTGDREETWFANILWDNGLAPVIDPTAAGWDLVVLDCLRIDEYGVPYWIEVSRSSSAPRKGISVVEYGDPSTFDMWVSPKLHLTLEGDPTLELAENSYHEGLFFAIKLEQDGTGSRLVAYGTTWGTINWTANGGTEPTMPTAAGSYCWLCFVCTDDGPSPVFELVGASGLAAEALTVSHLIGGTAAPAVVAGAGAGTSPTLALTRADDLSGMIELTTGTTPSAAAVIATLTFALAYGTAPNISLTPANAAAAALSGATAVWASSTTTTLVVNAGASALAAGTAYKWFYSAKQ